MGLINDFLHSTGFRSDNEHHRHEAYERGEITRETFKESQRMEDQRREAAGRLTVADYERVYGKR